MRALALTQSRLIAATIFALLMVPFALNLVRTRFLFPTYSELIRAKEPFWYGYVGYDDPTFGCFLDTNQPSEIILKRHVSPTLVVPCRMNHTHIASAS